jgi:cyclase
VDELMLLDVGCDKPDFKMVRSLTESAFMPVTVGGGIRSIQDMRDLLNAGADKVAINDNFPLVRQGADKFGSQAICAVVNYYGCLIPTITATQLEKWGAGEILLQSITRDGMMEGYDLDMIQQVSNAVNIPVIASCGCGTYQHMVEAVKAGASAIAAGAMFQFTDNTPKGAAEYLSNHGIEARLL